MTGQTPEVRPVVDVERGLRPRLSRQGERLQNRRLRARVRQVCASGHHRPRFGDEAGVDILLAQRHVRAIGPVEDQRKLLLVADAQKHQRRQTLRVRLHPAHIHALARQFLADEAPHMLIPNPRDQGRPQAQPRRARRDIRRGPADIFLERPHVLQPSPDLLAIEIDRASANGDHVKRLHQSAPSIVRSGAGGP